MAAAFRVSKDKRTLLTSHGGGIIKFALSSFLVFIILEEDGIKCHIGSDWCYRPRTREEHFFTGVSLSTVEERRSMNCWPSPPPPQDNEALELTSIQTMSYLTQPPPRPWATWLDCLLPPDHEPPDLTLLPDHEPPDLTLLPDHEPPDLTLLPDHEPPDPIPHCWGWSRMSAVASMISRMV